MMTTDKKIERIKEINDFIINQELTKLELERYVAKLNYLKNKFFFKKRKTNNKRYQQRQEISG